MTYEIAIVSILLSEAKQKTGRFRLRRELQKVYENNKKRKAGEMDGDMSRI